MMRMREKAVWASMFVLAGSLWWVTLTPTPYRSVDVMRQERVGAEIEFVANFTKTACTFKRLRVVGSISGQTNFIHWRDLDGLPDDDENRGAGQHTLRIAFPAQEGLYDWIEIRTQHDCDGVKVDKVFYRLSLR
tara:strand:- start:504 stop:905 length:402 start_codon:yes stop_codon:yes gene_type:complete